MNIKARKGSGYQRNSIATSSAQPVETVDKYAHYLLGGRPLVDKARNPRNLFDVSNKVDMKWLKIARKYLYLYRFS